MHYPRQIRSSILCLFLLTIVVPASESPWRVTGTPAAAGESEWQSASSIENEEGALGASRTRMREGTRIGSTMGKFYRNGRRWVFEFSPVAEPAGDSGENTASESTQEVREVRSTTNDRLTSTTTTVMTRSSSSSTSQSSGDAGTPSGQNTANVEVVRLRVLENLALQRIVAALTEDPNDAYWTITGTVTEFGNENWLLLTTILRSPSGSSE